MRLSIILLNTDKQLQSLWLMARDSYFLYYDATVKFMGLQHMFHAVLVLLVGILFPLLLLLLYPMQLFQKRLNKCHLNGPKTTSVCKGVCCHPNNSYSVNYFCKSVLFL